MAEALLRSMAADRFEVASAGLQKTFVHPLAIQVMREIGIDLTGHTSKTVDEFLGRRWDYVITVCDSAKERCPAFPERTRRVHFGVADPAGAQGTDEEKLKDFRWARDLLRQWMLDWLADQQAPSRRRLRTLRAAGLVILAVTACGIAWWTLDGAATIVTIILIAIAILTWSLWR